MALEKNDHDVQQEVTIKPADTSDLCKILLVDANGAPKLTKAMYEGRQMYIYSYVDKNSVSFIRLVGENDAIKENFISKLNNCNLKLVSVAGHGNDDCIYGYTLETSPNTPILSTNEVTERLATGKIFHFIACKTAKDLGTELVKNKAKAFIGYKEKIKFSIKDKNMCKPDCIIDQELIKGKTVDQAVEKAKAEYRKLMNNETTHGEIIGALELNCAALEVQGDRDAMLPQANNNNEQQQSISQDKQQTTGEEVQQNTRQDKQQDSKSQYGQQSTSLDEQQLGDHNQAASQHESRK